MHHTRAGAGQSKRWRSRRRHGHLGRRADRSNQVAATAAWPGEPLLPRRSHRATRLKSPVTTLRCPSTKCGQNPHLCVPARSRHRQVQPFPAPNTTTVIGINPFKAQNARTTRRLFRQLNHISQARMGGGLKFLSLGQMAGNRAEFTEIAENLRDAVRRMSKPREDK